MDTEETFTKSIMAHADDDPLALMFAAQRGLQVDAIGADPAEMEDEERCIFIKDMTLALTDELHEMLNEVGWKPWATSRHVNEEAAFKELIDAWHFFMNLLWAVMGPHVMGDPNILAQVFSSGYFAKREVNVNRQKGGYDGVTGKCPFCKRDLQETTCHKLETGWFCVEGAELP